MARYSELYLGDELIKLRDGLEVLERVVDHDALKDLDIWLYGVVTDEFVLDVAKEAIIDGSEEYMDDEGEPTLGEEDVELSEIAVAIPITSSDTIDILNGRGYPLRDLSFAYRSGEGEGVRTSHFINSHSAYSSSATIKVEQMREQAFAVDDMELDAFLQEKGKGAPIQVARKVQRNEEATVDAPHVPEPPPAKPPQVEGQPQQKAVASSFGGDISSIVEKFLG